MSVGEFKKRMYYSPDYKIVVEAKKEFPMKELNFFDPRDTREAEDFRKHVYDWYMKWFGSKEVKL